MIIEAVNHMLIAVRVKHSEIQVESVVNPLPQEKPQE